MRKIKIYCEDGALNKNIRSLKKMQNIELISFEFENRNKRTRKSKKPSELTCDSSFIKADSSILISDTARSELFEDIVRIVGAENYNDIRHIDTAYKEECQIFITSDKKDIVSKRKELEKLTGIKFFYDQDYAAIKSFVDEIS
ncbi:MAG: hypothetical protein JXB49_31525 [Bacteroidales bacterium]|nr:hypothetical protein [Bacteroidales bacterium]